MREEPATRILVGGNGAEMAVLRFDPATLALVRIQSLQVGSRPSWIHACRHRSLLLVNNETDQGIVKLFKWDGSSPDLASLDLVAEIPSMGADPCYMDESSDGKVLMVANYTGENVLFYPFDAKDASEAHVLRFDGISRNPDAKPHPHMAVTNPYDKESPGRIYIPDLGSDCIHIVNLDPTSHAPTIETSLHLPRGTGPRHLAFHPNGRTAYACLELTSELAVLALHPLALVSRHAAAPPPPAGTKQAMTMQAAAVVLSADARSVFVSNRFHASGVDSVARFELDAEEGLVMGAATWTQTGGKVVRGVGISGDGEWMCVGNLESDTVVIFRVGPPGTEMLKVAEVKLDQVLPSVCVWV
ncbi:Lactonase, 7-bladed beta-propeller-domain-containing protein [Chytriomyces sp. MP71]|nr:Lactonase, 7-bladed beta-propeller-domain-containing protein [Chytriomyces sp. MP71]